MEGVSYRAFLALRIMMLLVLFAGVMALLTGCAAPARPLFDPSDRSAALYWLCQEQPTYWRCSWRT